MPLRLSPQARVDRAKPIEFSLDGRRMTGFQGDTLASALLANGVNLVGRSFKYHRPRGFLSAGPEEPNGLFTVGDDGRTEPNVPGTTLELVEGLRARTQNAWPSVGFDLRAINSLAAPLLSAGFYYKTFMGPTRDAWMFYEPFIRRAAGLGRAVHERDPDRYESRHAFCDVLIVGAGPAGLVAAVAAGRAGARVLLAEQDSLLGGSLLLESVTSAAESWLRQIQAELNSLSNVEIRPRTVAAGLYDGSTVVLVEHRDHLRPNPERGEARQILTTLRARSIVFATGAMERPLIFPNNDRPGVMLASAIRSYLNRFAVACGRRAVFVTNNDSAYAAAFDASERGISVIVADVRTQVDAVLAQKAAASGIELITGATVLDVLGGKAVKGVVLATTAQSPRSSPAHKSFEQTRKVDCDLIGMSGGWSPVLRLTAHCGIKAKFREDIASFVPGGYAPGHFGAGAVTGAFTIEAAVEQGLQAGRLAAAHAGHVRAVPEVAPPELDEVVNRPAAGSGLEAICELPRLRPDKAFVDFQNDVTVKDLAIAHQEGYRSPEHVKRYTTLGMGTDQGKTSNVNALAVLNRLHGAETSNAAATTFRPPFRPLTIGALAGRTVGKHFRPTRVSPMHAWHLANGAEMIEAGVWLRPWYYQWAGPTAESAYIEEMRLVRRAVGISDVSTLGKIEVQGPDAAEFLNRVYVNGFAKLPIGKARYGVMLSDDGTVVDDGTATRLSSSRYFVTTSTAHGDAVLSWLEFLLQTAWTDLRVHVVSVTDELAGMVVAGPMARKALELALPADVSDATLPHMGCIEFDLHGVPLRLLRVSFSGELAYEIYCPADYGTSLWEHMLASATPLGMRPYGLEALASLRIEKGHVAGLELDHRNTLDDLGLGRMASKEKAFVGSELRQRPSLQSAQRWSLVGLECLEPGKRLRGGSILFSSSDRIEGHGRGYITSVTWSTELEKFIALGLYQGGLQHQGEEIICAYPLKGEQVRARIVATPFIDPTGERFRA